MWITVPQPPYTLSITPPYNEGALGQVPLSAVIQHLAHLVLVHIWGSQMLQELDNIWIITITCSADCILAPLRSSVCLMCDLNLPIAIST